MDRQVQPWDMGEIGSSQETCSWQDYAGDTVRDAVPVRKERAAHAAPDLSDGAWFHLVWFTAAMMGMPALIAALMLLF